MPIPVAAQSKASVCSRLFVATADSNPHGCLCHVNAVCCQKSLRRTDHSSRGVLPTVVRRCVWSWSSVGKAMTRNWVEVSQEKSNELGKCSALFGECTFQILTGTSAVLTTILVLYISHCTQYPNSASNRPRLLIPNHLQFLSHPNIDAVESEMQSIVKPLKPIGYCMCHQAYY